MSKEPQALHLARMLELGDDAFGEKAAALLCSQHELIGELVSFVDEYIEAWDHGMAGDSFLMRIAEKVRAKAKEQQ